LSAAFGYLGVVLGQPYCGRSCMWCRVLRGTAVRKIITISRQRRQLCRNLPENVRSWHPLALAILGDIALFSHQISFALCRSVLWYRQSRPVLFVIISNRRLGCQSTVCCLEVTQNAYVGLASDEIFATLAGLRTLFLISNHQVADCNPSPINKL
jgi:hypothetical protein